MLGSEFQFRDKVRVGVLGATGAVGQKFVELLASHPWFELTALAASERSAGKTYQEAVNWLMPTPLPPHIAEMIVQPCEPNLPCTVVFSGLDASVAGHIEVEFAKAGYSVLSNARNHRMDRDVPLLVPEVNPSHLKLCEFQNYGKGKIVTNPNCSVIGLTLTLKPLLDNFGIDSVHVVTLQATSGAGYPGVASLDILDNVIPYISGEEEKIETEPLKILGALQDDHIDDSSFKISAQCNRVPVNDGHMANVSIKLRQQASPKEVIQAWQSFTAEPQRLLLPTAPEKPIIYYSQNNYPQPKLHRNHQKGMAVSIGRLRPCPLFDYKFSILSHNTIRGAAGSAIRNAELMMRTGYLFW